MSKQLPRIFITRPFPGPGIAMLKDQFAVACNEKNRILTKQELKKAVKGVDAIVSLLTDSIDVEIMDAAGDQLRLISNYAIGYDNIDLRIAKERKITVTNTPGVLTHAIAEHTFALTFAIARRILEADQFTREHKYKHWDPFLFTGLELKGKTLGIIGLGRIGLATAEIAQKLEMKVIYNDQVRNHKIEKQHDISYHHFETVLKDADVISLNVPLLPTTHHLISKKELSLMKPTAILINTARGPVVDEKALIAALKKKEIFGAGLDVFEFEPNVSDALTQLPNVVLTPHIASATEEARSEMSKIVARNVIEFFEKGKAVTPVV